MPERTNFLGFTELKNPPNNIKDYLGLQSPDSPRVFVLIPSHFPRIGGVNYWLYLMSVLSNNPYLADFAQNREHKGTLSSKEASIFLASDNPYPINHERAHLYIDFRNPNIMSEVAKGNLYNPPSQLPFAYAIFSEGLAELVAIETGLKMPAQADNLEALRWRNFRLANRRNSDGFYVDPKMLQEKLNKIIGIYQDYSHTATQTLAIRKEQYIKALENMNTKDNHPTDSSTQYSVGLTYCLFHYRKLMSGGLSPKESIDFLILNPPENLSAFEEPVEQIHLLAA